MQVNFSKFSDGLVPAIIQDALTGKVLMQGFMNQEALNVTMTTGKVCFFSRSKQVLWTKGETSGHFLHVVTILVDCDGDSILIKAKPDGPVCHTGAPTCWGEQNEPDFFPKRLEEVIRQRINSPSDKSYVSSLWSSGINKIAQKVGEESIELVIESKDSNDELFLNEAADLLFHYLILLQAKGLTLQHVSDILEKRHKTK
jgi:phosphoribosyl-ATP pyrophosphohydrolase/phosphoribosyl-AMP cyclohydrolase